MTKPELAVIVPTKGRAHLLPRLMEGIARADEPLDVHLVLNSTDRLNYHETLNALHGQYGPMLHWLTVGDQFTYPDKLNLAAGNLHRQYPYLALLNDDHEPITPGWDVALKDALGGDKFGIAYGPDGIWEDGRIPSAPMITSSMYTALGWVALPGLHHILVDNVWHDLSEALGTRHFITEVRIQHHHYTNGEAEVDATYKETSGQANQDLDSGTYFAWRDGAGYLADVEKLRAL